MEEQQDVGTVVYVKGRNVSVEVVRGGGCKSCSMRGMCFGNNTPAVFDLVTDMELKEGDRVALEISPGIRVLSSLLVFAVPLAFLFGGFLLANVWLQELPSIGIAFAITALSFLLIRLIDKKLGGQLQVRIERKL